MVTAVYPVAVAAPAPCRHCGLACQGAGIATEHGTFCCDGCEAVFSLLHSRGLTQYYQCETAPGAPQQNRARLPADRFAVLDDPEIAGRVIEFDDGRTAVATFLVPSMHCASCVWLLEQLWRFDPGAQRSEVDLQRRTIRIEYQPSATCARRLAERLASLGYEPILPGEDGPAVPTRPHRRLLLQLGIAGFAFGNSMLFSVPYYAKGAPVEDGLQRLFDGLNLLLAVPVLVFSAADYFRRAWQALRRATMAIDVPIALGLTVLFGRSLADLATGRGPGFLDSFTGLAFFLLVGRLFQQRVFDRLAFDRTFLSFLPLSVQVDDGGRVGPVRIDRLEPGDCVLLRPEEIVPADARLLDDAAAVDYRCITGEDTAVVVRRGDLVRAGGRALESMRLQVMRHASQSQLARLWAHPLFGEPKRHWLADVAPRFGGWFSAAALGLAAAGAFAWRSDALAAANVATAVLIVACPCALTLAAPITLGTAMTRLGRRGLYLKRQEVVLDLSRIDTLVFDKTGTLTGAGHRRVVDAHGLDARGWALVRQLARESSHPVSRALAGGAGRAEPGRRRAIGVRAVAGQGLTGTVEGVRVAIGSATFVARETGRPSGPTDRTYVLAGEQVGWIRLAAAPRPGIEAAASALAGRLRLHLLSGDTGEGDSGWSRVFGTRTRFRQSPEDKLAFVAGARRAGHRVMMVGDGLNDAGALAAADVGLAVSDDTACLVPACDGIVSGDRLVELPSVLRFARRARHVLVLCFIVSVAYNVAGLTLALAGQLTPLASAVLMPVSSLTIVALSAGGVRWSARRLLPS